MTILLPNRKEGVFFGPRPLIVCEFTDEAGQQCYEVLEGSSSGHPGSTYIRLSLLDSFGNLQFESEFDTGWRCYLYGTALEPSADGLHPLIVLETGIGDGPGPDYAKQVIARIGKRFDLVRLEHGGGKATRNDYYVKHFACGPPIPEQTEEEWEGDLLSADRLKVLRALVWLGGMHDAIKPAGEVNPQHEDPQDVALVRAVRQREKVVGRLQELGKSMDRWLQEAAQLALEPQDAR